MARPHAVLVPYPGSGNINPTLQLAKLLHLHGVYVTFVNTEHNHRLAQAAEGPCAVRGRDGFRFEVIPDGLLEADRGAQDYDLGLSRSTSHRCAEPLRALIARLNCTDGVPQVTCLVPSALMSFALDVAKDMGIRSLVLWGASACSLMGHMSLRELIQRGYVPLKDESCMTNGYLKTILDWIPGMPPIQLGDISSFVRTTDPDDFGLKFNEVEANKCTMADGLILNTFDELEADVLSALKAEYSRIYTIGPLPSLLRHHQLSNSSTTGLSLWKPDTRCIEWLDAQKPGSVVYANFGSLTALTAQQLAEFAWGLAASGHPFLWVIRPNLLPGGLAALPPSFVAETKDRACFAAWCAQEQVLCHPTVGCFLTHNGWNSTCESIWAGVPMICWPVFADQYTNCKYVCEEWGVGLRLDEEVRRDQVREHVEEMMEGKRGEEMRRNAASWKGKGMEATSPGGSSHENLQRIVHELNSI